MSGAPSSSSTNTDRPYAQVNEFPFISALVLVEYEKSFSLAFSLYHIFGRSGISFSCLLMLLLLLLLFFFFFVMFSLVAAAAAI